jgi:hypothetical protein
MLRSLGVALAFAVSLAGCKPKAGTPCSAEGKKVCIGDDALLVCEHGTFAAFSCKGPGGCSSAGDIASCDITRNAQGDPCPSDDTGRKACKPDGKTQLRCDHGHFTEVACAGVGGCKTREDGTSQCDRGEPDLGTTCSSMSPSSCNLKSDSLYGCVGGKWAVTRACRGPHGCKPSDVVGTYCDLGVVAGGDACESDEEGRVTCGPERAGLYTCKDGRFQLLGACPAGKACAYSDGELVGNRARGPLVMLPKGAECR